VALEFLLEIYGLYDNLVSNTLLHTVLPYISLDILVQRYVAKRDRNLGYKGDSFGEQRQSPKSNSEEVKDAGEPPVAKNESDEDHISWRFRRWWKSALAWLGLEEG